MNSTLVKGKVFHERFFPESHRFSYPVWLYCLDLDELESLDRDLPGFSYNRAGISSIRDSDYLDGKPGSIKDKLLSILEKAGCNLKIERIMLATTPRLVFKTFNPVSFYYCLGENHEILCLVAEVNNTFGDRHLYLLKPGSGGEMRAVSCSAAKTFHVSPFNRVEGEYEFHFGPIEEGIDIRITMIVDGRKKFIASLQGEHLPLTRKTQSGMRLRHPLQPHLTMLRILREAALLYFRKKLKYVPRPAPSDPMTIGVRPPTVFQKISMGVFLRVMKGIREGGLSVTLPDRRTHQFGDPEEALQASMEILDYEFFSRVILREDIGFGESYMLGLFRTSDLSNLVAVMTRGFNRRSRPRLLPALLSGALARFARFRERNSLVGSRRNISRHYDLSNDFFRLFLDDSMTYSCAIFKSPDDTLEQAQDNKLQAVIDKALIKPGHHVLEIGSGWGSFAVAAVRRTGCKVTTITLSREQYEYVTELVRRMGMEDRITALLQDYRSLAGKFDRIISIEMLEAVGHQYLGKFFSQCNHLLNPGGRAVLQVITIPDQRYLAYRLRLDWIQKHIFPGGHLPSLTAMCNAMTRKSPFILEGLENIGPHYAETLHKWYRRFMENRDKIRELGYDEIFLRKWEFYLQCCEALFRERGLEDLQMVIVRPFESPQ